jgi:hypothetical protein
MNITHPDTHITRVTLSARNVEALADAIPYLTPGRTFTLRRMLRGEDGRITGELLLVEVEGDAEHYATRPEYAAEGA